MGAHIEQSWACSAARVLRNGLPGGWARKGTQDTEVVGLHEPLSASAGGPGRFTYAPLKVPEGMAGLASDLSLVIRQEPSQ